MRTRHAMILSALLLIVGLTAGCSLRRASTPPAASPSAGQTPGVVGVVLREFEFEPRPLKTRAGRVRFLLINRRTADHDFTIPAVEGHDLHEKHLVKPGRTLTVELELKPGVYEAICTLPGHRDAGMAVRVEVSS